MRRGIDNRSGRRCALLWTCDGLRTFAASIPATYRAPLYSMEAATRRISASIAQPAAARATATCWPVRNLPLLEQRRRAGRQSVNITIRMSHRSMPDEAMLPEQQRPQRARRSRVVVVREHLRAMLTGLGDHLRVLDPRSWRGASRMLRARGAGMGAADDDHCRAGNTSVRRRAVGPIALAGSGGGGGLARAGLSGRSDRVSPLPRVFVALWPLGIQSPAVVVRAGPGLVDRLRRGGQHVARWGDRRRATCRRWRIRP